ncbi:MAG: polyhydroxyalkanoic acid system family protein [Parcubacteria group bacterium]|nr:polyhydroxyalkanoic acid system family protein [Parcubacteria group bacterium]
MPMPHRTLEFDVPFRCLSVEQAHAALAKLTDNLVREFADEQKALERTDEHENIHVKFSFLSFEFQGDFSIRSDDVRVFLRLSFLTSLLRGKIEQMIGERVSRALQEAQHEAHPHPERPHANRPHQ